MKKPSKQPVKKDQQINLSIESLAPGGKGVAKVDGFPVFIERSAPGDQVAASVYDVRKSFALAKIDQILESSQNRVEAPCDVYDRCGGCQWQHIDYQAQLKFKQDLVVQTLTRIGDLDKSIIEETVGTSNQMRYRNKVQFPVAFNKDKRTLEAGYYERNSHVLVNINECPVQPEDLDKVLATTKVALSANKITAYDESTHSGLIRHILIRKSMALNEILLTLVINMNSMDEVDDALLQSFHNVESDLKANFENLVGFCINFNSRKGNRILGNETICLKGSNVIEEVLSSPDSADELLKKGIKFRLSSNSFFQIHSSQAVTLLDKIYQKVKETDVSDPIIVDAYAGVGTIAMWLSNCADKLYAIEENPFAVSDGKVNQVTNGITNVEFMEGSAEEKLNEIIDSGIKVDILILDPPRKGLSSKALEATLKLAAEHIIYVSCNPSTLARDLKHLEDGKVANFGYKTQRVTPIDMFPQTYHVESLAYLKRIKPVETERKD